ncbi:MFS transporter [Salinicola halophyticus]|uniref:MFS transporter n=1 Tax=Salinicola halophyticus TaxID=1808881 RepID=UPI003F44A1CD
MAPSSPNATNTLSASPSSEHAQPPSVPRRLIILLAISAGLSVASLYYVQPLLGILAADIDIDARTAGLIPTLTQLGYALGILLLIPLGDRVDRRRLIVFKAALLALALLATALAPSIATLLVASLAVGLTATIAQDIVPAAAMLAADRERGKVVGTVMTGLLLGILLSRVVSGVVAEALGWRAMFFIATGLIVLVGVALWRGLPRFESTSSLSYRALLATLYHLWRDQPELRRAATAQALLSVAFSAFWSTLSIHLLDAYQLGSAVSGAFGLAGAAGALAAPLAGRMADRRGPHQVTRIGSAIVVVSFLAMAAEPWLSAPWALGLIVIGALGFDFGIQATLVSHQTLIYGLDPAARSRLNAVMFTLVFIGMAVGSALGSYLLGAWGWPGVIALATLASLGALLIRVVDQTPALAVEN